MQNSLRKIVALVGVLLLLAPPLHLLGHHQTRSFERCTATQLWEDCPVCDSAFTVFANVGQSPSCGMLYPAAAPFAISFIQPLALGFGGHALHLRAPPAILH